MVVVVSGNMGVLGLDGVVHNLGDHGGGWLMVVNNVVNHLHIGGSCLGSKVCIASIAATGGSAGVLDPTLLAAANLR